MTRFGTIRRFGADLAYRFGGWPRRLVAAGCLVLAVMAAVSDHRRTAAPARTMVVVATRHLLAGTALVPADIRAVPWASETVPSGALTDPRAVAGAMLAGSMTSGEPFTTARLLGRGLTAGLGADQVAITVGLADAAGASLIQAGDLVDLLVASSSSGDLPTEGSTAAGSSDGTETALNPSARVLVSRVRVLAVLISAASRADSTGPASLVVATDLAGSLRIAGAADAAILATLRSPA
jgi:Flp pilus assembly protein CpaB